MKTFPGYLLLTTLAFSGSLAMPSWGKDCPEIPQKLKQLTVKSNAAILRKEPSQDSEKGVSFFEGDKLKVIEHTPRKDLSGTDSCCWYLNSKASDQGTYFIADINIEEAPFPKIKTLKVNFKNPVLFSQEKQDYPIFSNQEDHRIYSRIPEEYLVFFLIIIMVVWVGFFVPNQDNLESLLSKFSNRHKRSQPKAQPPLSSSLSSQAQDPSIKDITLKNKSIEFNSQQENLFYTHQLLAFQKTLANIDQKLNQYLEQLQNLTASDQSQQESLNLLEERLKNLENLAINQETHNSIELLDLPIMLYIRKNGNTSLQELLNNIHCDEENLKERLIALQKENLIHIADDHDPQNPIYRL